MQRSVTTIRRSRLPALTLMGSPSDPTVLLVHGANASKTCWRATLDELQNIGVSGAAIDLRGHGNSEGVDRLQQYQLADYVRDVTDALDALPTVRHLVGHSMGGLVCQLVAASRKLNKLTLVASSPVEGMRAEASRMFLRHPATFTAAIWKRSFLRLYQNRAVARSLLFHPATSDQTVSLFLQDSQEESWLAASQMKTILPSPKEIDCHVDVLAGERDFMVSRKASEATARAYRTRLHVVQRCGHMIPYEADPAELARLLGAKPGEA